MGCGFAKINFVSFLRQDPSPSAWRKQMKWTASSFAIFLTVASALPSAQAASLPSADNDVVSRRFQKLNFPGTNQDLHMSEYKFPDGAKGKRVEVSDENPAIEGSGKYKNSEEEIFHSQVCSADLIALGADTDSAAVLSKSKDQIYTVSQIKPTEIVRQSTAVNIGTSFSAIQLGGEITDEKELLRLQIVGSQTLTAGNTYLLFLKNEEKASTPVFYVQHAIKVTNGRIYPHRPWLDITSGTPYAEMKGKIESVQNIEACR
jgi:hypothetical protein